MFAQSHDGSYHRIDCPHAEGEATVVVALPTDAARSCDCLSRRSE
jgi:hypothetical protein